MQTPALDLSAFEGMPFPVASTVELRRRGMVSIEAMERKLLVLWNGGEPRVFVDSCAHLGLPLSLGRYQGDSVRCRYHGWAYSSDTGEVVDQPTLRKKQPCSLRRMGCLVAGGLVFSWTGDPEAGEAARARLPEDVIDDFSLYRLSFDTPFYMALFSSVDYAHFPFHTSYKGFYKLYGALRGNDHVPGTAFPSKVVDEDERKIVVQIPEADREIRMYATAAEMDDGGINFFQTYVTPVSPMKTLYWECYRPRSESRVMNLLARATFRTVTRRLLYHEDRVWVAASAPNFVEGENIHLCENDVPLGAHLRKFVLPPMRAAAGAS